MTVLCTIKENFTNRQKMLQRKYQEYVINVNIYRMSHFLRKNKIWGSFLSRKNKKLGEDKNIFASYLYVGQSI